MQWPLSNALGVVLAAAAGVLLLVAFATTGLAPIVLGAIVLAVVLYVAYVVLINIHRWSTTLSTRRGGRQ